jgi:hypothetical protein
MQQDFLTIELRNRTAVMLRILPKSVMGVPFVLKKMDTRLREKMRMLREKVRISFVAQFLAC